MKKKWSLLNFKYLPHHLEARWKRGTLRVRHGKAGNDKIALTNLPIGDLIDFYRFVINSSPNQLTIKEVWKRIIREHCGNIGVILPSERAIIAGEEEMYPIY